MIFRKAVTVLLLLLGHALVETEASNILIVAPFFGKSHSKIIHTVGLGLARRGHNMTVITYNTLDNAPSNYKQIVVEEDPLANFPEGVDFMTKWTMMSHFEVIDFIKCLLDSSKIVLESPSVKNLLEDEGAHFDLVVVELFLQQVLYLFAHRFQAPLAMIGTTTFQFDIAESMGNPIPMEYVYHNIFKSKRNGFGSKIENLMLRVYEKYFIDYRCLPIANEMSEAYFKNAPKPLPKIEDMRKNISLVLLNTHFSYDNVIPMVPGIVEIGGVHINNTQIELPEHIQKFMDSAEHGVIFFALGSFLRSDKLPEEKLRAFIGAFTKLKQKVIWKWEGENPPFIKDIIFLKWAPQFDILGHPNVRLFIGHGGMLSVQETIYQGIPFLGLPFYADQYRNVEMIKDRGMGEFLHFEDVNEKNVRNLIEKIINDRSYYDRAKEVSSRFRNRQNDPLDTAIYWLEYVIKYKDARILKSPLPYVSFWEYHFIDVLKLVVLFMNLLVFYLFWKLINLCRNRNNKQNKLKYN